MLLKTIKAKMGQSGIGFEWLFYVGYFAFLVGATVTYSVMPLHVMNLVKYAGLALMFIYMLYANRRAGWKTWLILVLLYAVAMIVSRVSGTRLMLEILVFITAFKDINFNKFLKYDFLLRLGIVLVVIGLYLVGILDDVGRYREGGTIRYGLGFLHPNMLGLQIVFLALEYVYLNRKGKNLWSLLVVLAALVFEYKIPNCRTAVITLAVLMPFLLMTKKLRRVIFGNKFVGYFLKSSFVIFLILAFSLAFWYTSDNSIMRGLDVVFSNRLAASHYYLEGYGIFEPFGNDLDLEATGFGEVRRSALDVGYMHVLLRFGWIAIIALAIAYWMAMSFLQKNRNWAGMMILFVIAFYSMLETGTLFGVIDPFLSIFAVAIYGTIRGLTSRIRQPKGDVLLLTWVEGDNYGTALQSWCLKQIVNNFSRFVPGSKVAGREVDVLNYRTMMDYIPRGASGGLWGKIKRFQGRSLEQNKERMQLRVRKFKLRSNLQRRERLFDEFRQNELNLFPDEMIDDKKYLRKMPKFKTYLIGSDQVWNPNLLDSTYLLKWAPKDSVRISYAPSVCVNSIGKGDLTKYAALKQFSKLSVREYTDAVGEISKYINKKIEEVVDPVVLYGREELLKLCHISKMNDYCFSYLLGASRKSRKYVKEFAEHNKLRLKAVTSVNKEHMLADEILDESAVWCIPPLKIIDYIFNARVVITDSFHVMVICVLLHKQFIILAREKGKSQQNNRIVKFLRKINLERRFGFAPKNIASLKFSIYEWALCDCLINIQRKKSFKYLERALEQNARMDEKKKIRVNYANKNIKIKVRNINLIRKMNEKRKQQEKRRVDIIIKDDKSKHSENKKQEKPKEVRKNDR